MNTRRKAMGDWFGAALLSATRFWSKVDRSGGPDACWPWTADKDRKGYGRFNVLHGKVVQASRVAYALTYGNPECKAVCHKCDNPPCCNPAHLWLGSIAENNVDMTRKLRHGMRRLSLEDAMTIRAQYESGGRPVDIATRFEVTPTTVIDIGKGRTWKWVEV